MTDWQQCCMPQNSEASLNRKVGLVLLAASMLTCVLPTTDWFHMSWLRLVAYHKAYFKDSMRQILHTAQHSETEEERVVDHSLCDEYGV